VSLSLVCLGLIAVPGWAQTVTGWEVQWEQLRLDVKGADQHVGDITTITRVQTFAPPRLDDRVTHDPIGLNMDVRNAFRAEVSYRGQQWGAGVGGWFLRTRDSLSGQVASPAVVRTPASNTSVTNTILMWDELLSPLSNDLEASGMSPIDYHANGRLRTATMDAYALATLANSDSSHLDLIVGGKGVRVRAGEEQGFSERAFILNAFRPLHFNNYVSLSSTGNAKLDGVGPMVGLTGRTSWRRLRLDVSVTESVLFGSADQSGVFTDIDDVTLAQGPAGPFIPCPLPLAAAGCHAIRSDWTFSKSEKVLIPITELQLRFLVEVTRHIAVGASSFTSLWSSVPAPPSFVMSHSDAGPGLDWELRQRSLRFGAAGLVANVRF
jgi:hypothetical protein